MTAVLRVNGEHLHDLVNAHDAQCHILRNNCKRKANENITDIPSKIMRLSCVLLKILKWFRMILKIFEFQYTEKDVNYCR